MMDYTERTPRGLVVKQVKLLEEILEELKTANKGGVFKSQMLEGNNYGVAVEDDYKPIRPETDEIMITCDDCKEIKPQSQFFGILAFHTIRYDSKGRNSHSGRCRSCGKKLLKKGIR